MKTYIIAACTLLASTTTFAGVAEKKAQKASDAKAAASLAEVKTACGNETLTVTIDWPKYDAFIDNNKALVDNGFSKKTVFEKAGGTAKAVLESFVRVCEDEDYKAEITKVTSIVFTPNDNPAANKYSASLEGTTFTLQAPGTGSSLSADGAIEAAF